jgi:predicted NBD/HSP70 family sugar kinase
MRYLGLDFGGTGIKGGLVNPETGVCESRSIDLDTRDFNKDEELSAELFWQIHNKFSTNPIIAISAAGVIDQTNLTISGSPNARIKDLSFPRALKERGYAIHLVNDLTAMASRVLLWQKRTGIVVSNMGTGYSMRSINRGRIAPENGEPGHIPYAPRFVPSWALIKCNCSQEAESHLEPYVAGVGAPKMAAGYFAMYPQKMKNHPIIEDMFASLNNNDAPKKIDDIFALAKKSGFRSALDGMLPQNVYDAFEKFPEQEPQNSILRIQRGAVADHLGIISGFFDPQEILLVGGTARVRANILTLPAIEMYTSAPMGKYGHPNKPRPKITISQNQNLGIEGAVANYLLHEKRYL